MGTSKAWEASEFVGCVILIVLLYTSLLYCSYLQERRKKFKAKKTGDDESPEFDFADMKGKINIIHAQRWVYIHTNVYIYVA